MNKLTMYGFLGVVVLMAALVWEPVVAPVPPPPAAPPPPPYAPPPPPYAPPPPPSAPGARAGAPVSDTLSELEILDKGLHEIAVAKAKAQALDEHLEKISEAFGPEGKEIYEALKAKAKAVIQKGIAWLKKKLGRKASVAPPPPAAPAASRV